MSGGPFADGTRTVTTRPSDTPELGPMLAAWIIAVVPLVWTVSCVAIGMVFEMFRGGK